MPITVNVHEAKTHLSRLLERVQAGEEIIIARAGQPCARLAPLADNPSPRQPGRLRGQVSPAFFDPLPEAELAAWELATKQRLGELGLPMRCSASVNSARPTGFLTYPSVGRPLSGQALTLSPIVTHSIACLPP
jgi:prevent-host-death family protein